MYSGWPVGVLLTGRHTGFLYLSSRCTDALASTHWWTCCIRL